RGPHVREHRCGGRAAPARRRRPSPERPRAAAAGGAAVAAARSVSARTRHPETPAAASPTPIEARQRRRAPAAVSCALLSCEALFVQQKRTRVARPGSSIGQPIKGYTLHVCRLAVLHFITPASSSRNRT